MKRMLLKEPEIISYPLGPIPIRSFSASRSLCLQPRYFLCAAAHNNYAQKVDMCSGCPKSPVVNGRAWQDSA
jgi:hypothetical protein